MREKSQKFAPISSNSSLKYPATAQKAGGKLFILRCLVRQNDDISAGC
jgi:hypothetical protein